MGGERGEIPNLTVGALFERYRLKVSPGKKGKRWETIRLLALEKDRLAAVRLRSLATPHVAEWQERRLEAVAAPSVRRERNLVNHVFEIAINEWHWLKKNPFGAKGKAVRRPKDRKGRERIASDEETGKLLKAASPNMHRVITFALETGMRASEIANLRLVVGHVAFVSDSKNNEGRQVSLSEKALKVWQGGFGLTAGSISALFARLCEEEEIEGLTFHDLRHTACTRLAGKLDLFELCTMFGWKDPRHAKRYYNKTAADIAKKL